MSRIRYHSEFECLIGYDLSDISENTFYRWRRRFGGMAPNEAARVRDLERENSRLQRLLAERALALDVARELVPKK